MNEIVVVLTTGRRRVVYGFRHKTAANLWLDEWIGKSQSRTGFVCETEPKFTEEESPLTKKRDGTPSLTI